MIGPESSGGVAGIAGIGAQSPDDPIAPNLAQN